MEGFERSVVEAGMDGEGFACPECGGEIRLKGLSPGRRVRCGWCRTSVEVPFIPRAESIVRRRQSSRRPSWLGRWPLWAKAAVTVLAVAIVVAGGVRAARSRRQRAENDAVARLVASSRAAESSGRLGEALAELEAALVQATRLEPPPGDLEQLRSGRDRLAVREVEAQLAALDAGVPAEDAGRSVGRALTLLARARKDEAIEGLEPKILDTLEQLRLRSVAADADAADAAEAGGRANQAMALCRRQYATASDLARAPRSLWQARATALAGRIIARQGAIVEPVHGEFTFGTPAGYAKLLSPTLTVALLREGYLPRPPDPLWDDLWSTAPYRVSLEIKERQDDTYFESQSRVSAIDATLTLANQGKTVWYEKTMSRTQVPLPGLPAYLAGRNSVGTRRNPEFERLLYNNARDDLLGRLSNYLQHLPACPKSGATTPVR